MPRILVTNDDGIYSEGLRKLADVLRDGQAQILEMIAMSAPLEAVLDRLVRLGETEDTLVVRLAISGRSRKTGTPFESTVLELVSFQPGGK